METLTSHKFIAAIVALVVVFFGDRAGLDAQQVTEAVAVLISYIIGRGLATNASAKG
jgi:hypothetical protein